MSPVAIEPRGWLNSDRAALPGGLLPAAIARQYAYVRGDDLHQLMHAAAALRDAGKGRVVGYSRKVFLPLVRLCRNRCHYCSFSRPERGEPLVMSPEALLRVAREGEAKGCKEALFCLGERAETRYPSVRKALAEFGHDSTVAYLAAMCDLVWRETGLMPHFNCGVLEEAELAILKDVSLSCGLMLESTSERLCQVGGPHFASPGKVPARRTQTIAAAGRLGMPFSTGILVGIGETPDERIDSLLAIRDLQHEYGHIQEVIIQNFQPHLRTPMAGDQPPETSELLRTIALARLILGPEMNIQAPPNLGPRVYHSYLLAGANDWGGISPVTKDLINPESPWPAVRELHVATVAAGFTLRERLAVYPEFVLQPDRIAPRFRPAVQQMLGDDGFVRATK